MNIRHFSAAVLVLALVELAPGAAWAQLIIQDNFINGSSSFNWATFNGACLTAGDGTGTIPACKGLTYYQSQTLVGGQTGTLPDSVGNGALRFTNGYTAGAPTGNFQYGYNQSGAVVSNFTFPTSQGLHVTFTTVTYRGQGGVDGADGMSFFLMDGAQPPTIGAFGGSLAYSCSISNPGHDGVYGGYIGLGIDEYGNFLNGAALMPGYTGSNTASGDNSALGYGFKPGRIGLRGAGSVSWNWLNTTYPTLYPSTWGTTQQQNAVQNTCHNGYLSDGTKVSGSVYGNAFLDTTGKKISVLDYAPIPNAYKELSGVTIANESATTRLQAVPITYDLKITQDGLLSFAFSYNGGANQPVISGQQITASNGALPGTFRFGFAGSTGGATNIHEILCFKATPFTTSASSGGINQQQSAQVQVGTQVYFAFYDPANWTGSLTANNVLYNPAAQSVSIATVANWDASCVLTLTAGQVCGATGVTATGPQGPSSRTILSWNGTTGIPFEWANLTTTEQAALTAGGASPANASRVAYLRGERTSEITSTGSGLYRARVSVLSDIVDSSPTLVGKPAGTYASNWIDLLYPTATVPEKSGQTYAAFVTIENTRLNIVYAGANDGLLHGFRTGAYNSSGTYVSTGSTPNDGLEVLAYLPGAFLTTIHNTTDSTQDFSSPQYSHSFYVDATPGTGDIYYQGAWHTWLVGGFGPGGAGIYALDVTNPSNFSETNASSLVIGEWNASTISCASNGGCGSNLGNTYGVPTLRRFHNGMWGAVFGNGFGSSTGDAGIYIMTIDPTTAAKTFYYLSAGKAGTADGIASAYPADIDGDNITDFIYAGDLNGNLWRFDVTSNDPAQWIASAQRTLLFKTAAGQPITTLVIPVDSIDSPGLPRVIIDFGTGQQFPVTATAAATYATGPQALYGIWDANFNTWNTKSPVKYATVASPATVTASQLTTQSILSTVTSAGGLTLRTGSSNPVCWSGSTVCGTGNTKFGWTMALPGAGEQIIFNPEVVLGAFTVNTTIPATNSPFSCIATVATGFTLSLSPTTGGAFAQSVFGDSVNSFITYNSQVVVGIGENGTGSVSFVTAGGNTFFLTQTTGTAGGTTPPTPPSCVAGSPGCTPPPPPPCQGCGPYNPPPGKGNRITWIQRR